MNFNNFNQITYIHSFFETLIPQKSIRLKKSFVKTQVYKNKHASSERISLKYVRAGHSMEGKKNYNPDDLGEIYLS